MDEASLEIGEAPSQYRNTHKLYGYWMFGFNALLLNILNAVEESSNQALNDAARYGSEAGMFASLAVDALIDYSSKKNTQN